MNDKISVVICNHYKLELKSVLSQKGFEDFLVIHAPTGHVDPTRCSHTKKFVDNLLYKNQTTNLIGGSCMSISNKTFRESGGVNLQKVNQCHYFLASEAIVDGLQNQGAYLVSPGWLISWKKKIDFWGFDQKTAQEFFHEATSKIVLLDTGVYEKSREDLKDFAQYLDLPYETLYVGLDHFKMYLKIVMNEFKSADNEKERIQQDNNDANYAMALELVHQLSESKSAGETVQQTINIFNMLFSPERIIFHSKTEGTPSSPEPFQFEGATCLSNNGRGFFVKISFEGEIYGVIEIVDVALPQYLNEYINLTLNLIGVVSLALKEAAYKEKLLTTTEQLEWELAVNAALSEISNCLINQENDMEYLTHRILGQALKLTGSEHGFVSVVDEKTGDNIGYTLTQMMGSACRIEGEDRKIAFSIDDNGTYNGLWGHSLKIRGFFTNDPAHHQEAKGIPPGHVKIEKFLTVPAIAGEKLVGQIALANPGGDYSDRDLQAITRLSNLYALAIEQKKVEDINARMAAIVESTDDAILGKTLEGIITNWNPGAEKLYGYIEEEAIGQSISILVPGDRPDEVEGIIKQIKRGELVERFETVRVKKDGEKIEVSLNISPIKNKIGEISGASSIAMNISDRKKAERALREAEFTKELALDAGRVGVFDWDLKNNILIWDDILYNLYGVSKEDFSGAYEAWSSGLHPDDKEKAEEDVQLALQGEKDFNTEFRVVRKDGSVHYINARATVFRDESGDPVRMLGVNWDITAQKRAEEELILHSEIMKNMAEGVYLIGADDGLIKYANPKFEEMFGYTPGEMVGQHASIVNAPTKDPLETANKIMGILNETGVWHGEIENNKKDGTHFWCDANVSVFNHQQYGRVLIAVHSDITQRKEDEEKLKALTAGLVRQKKQLELLATTDSLTGLLNRRSFIERVENEIIRQQRNGKTFSIVMSDIDNFKNINDSYGHPFGDSVLIKVADTFRAKIRSQDFVSRWGGEEFILLLPETDLKGALVLSEKIRKNLESSGNWFEDRKVTVTATFGISECRPQDNYLESIKKADQALYEGKKAGRNCIIS